MNGWHENFGENRFINMLIVRQFSAPVSPFILLHIVEIIIAKSTLGEFHFHQRSKNTIELIQYFIIVLTTTDTATVSPHNGENKECLINNFQILLFLLGSIVVGDCFVWLNENAIKDSTNCLNEAHGGGRSQICDFSLVHHIWGCFNIGLEASEKHCLCNFMDWWEG